MRRHPNRLRPCEAVELEGNVNPRRRKVLDNRPKRGPKNKLRLWPTLNYTIEPYAGVVFHSG